ncbi:hypothetical protein HMPREF0653_01148 [Prevotella disiens JCM 6334 = ATCC 29426]|uniref:Uncharacterized protein n=1 Tax=Prevotella disiens JCM 6334 = ATCC 29426 TaxID=1235811 RepID=A0ABP2Y7Q8_9BACT|nr:hypothetical protein HMPREF0653_01148 [Prevotella disiens JCM 6334 = ATCC 29426]
MYLCIIKAAINTCIFVNEATQYLIYCRGRKSHFYIKKDIFAVV